MIADAIRRAVEREDLDAATMEGAMGAILAGEASEAQIAALAIGIGVGRDLGEDSDVDPSPRLSGIPIRVSGCGEWCVHRRAPSVPGKAGSYPTL
jgi:hypothetical protein